LSRLNRLGAVTLAVPPLDDQEMRRLVAAIWPRDGSELAAEIERVCALADGKPYFAEELVRSAATAHGRFGLDAPPLSIRAGVLARFEELAPPQRRLLLVASVIGPSFDAGFLAQVAACSTGEVAAALTRARDALLVREIRDKPGAFVFRHAMTREILYRELLAFEAQTFHREIARRLEAAGAANPFDLAHHWSSSGEPERARAAYELAGDIAFSRNAHRDAELAYRGAVASCNDGDSAAPVLCEKLSRVLSVNGNVEAACEFAERAVNGYVTSGNSHHAAFLAVRLARRRYESGDPAAAAAMAHHALALSGGDGPVAYDAYVTLAHFEALQGNRDAAISYLASADTTPGEHLAVDRRNAHMVRAIHAATSGCVTDAFTHYEAAVSIARAMSDPEQLAWTLNNYGSRAMATGWMNRASAAHAEAARCARSREFGKVGAATIAGLAFVELLSGDLDAVRARREEDAQMPPGIAMTQTARTALGVRLAYYCGDDAQAAALAIPEAVELAFASNETQRIGLLAGCVAAYYDAVGRREEAAALRSRALPMIRSVEFCFWLLDQTATGNSAAERDQARNLLVEAARDPGNLAAKAYLSLFDARVARLLRNPAARSLADDAAAQFEQIGWPWERAQALEIAGRYAQAIEVYRRKGFLRHVRELERSRRRARHRAGTRELTVRETEVARLAAQGKSNREIAEALFIGERTVETHIAAIFDRFDLTSRRQLAALLDDRGEQVAGESSS
jgi:DNA-binding CsgD family transcriptional regulator